MTEPAEAAPCAAHPDSVNSRLAAHLRRNQETITQEWLARVVADPEIKTETLTTAELQAQLPTLFQGLLKALCDYGSEAVAKKAELASARHGAQRWRQGYDLTELLREIAHLRTVFIYHLRVFEAEHEDFGMAARLFAETTVHGFLDEMIAAAAEQFVKSERAEQRSG
jgi:hypothetical protein